MPVVYCLLAEDGRRSYIGYTVNFQRRLRQHRGELKGGAHYTSMKRFGRARPLFVVHGLPTKRVAMQLEWRLKRCRNGQPRGPPSKRCVGGLCKALRMPQWTSKAPPVASLGDLRVEWFAENGLSMGVGPLLQE